MRRVLPADLPGRFYDRELERRVGLPRSARVRTDILEPASSQELSESGRYWRRTLIGPHVAPTVAEPMAWDDVLPHPELWHYDDTMWLRRSQRRPDASVAESFRNAAPATSAYARACTTGRI